MPGSARRQSYFSQVERSADATLYRAGFPERIGAGICLAIGLALFAVNAVGLYKGYAEPRVFDADWANLVLAAIYWLVTLAGATIGGLGSLYFLHQLVTAHQIRIDPARRSATYTRLFLGRLRNERHIAAAEVSEIELAKASRYARLVLRYHGGKTWVIDESSDPELLIRLGNDLGEALGVPLRQC